MSTYIKLCLKPFLASYVCEMMLDEISEGLRTFVYEHEDCCRFLTGGKVL